MRTPHKPKISFLKAMTLSSRLPKKGQLNGKASPPSQSKTRTRPKNLQPKSRNMRSSMRNQRSPWNTQMALTFSIYGKTFQSVSTTLDQSHQSLKLLTSNLPKRSDAIQSPKSSRSKPSSKNWRQKTKSRSKCNPSINYKQMCRPIFKSTKSKRSTTWPWSVSSISWISSTIIKKKTSRWKGMCSLCSYRKESREEIRKMMYPNNWFWRGSKCVKTGNSLGSWWGFIEGCWEMPCKLKSA
jgi:hypothetical protein